MEPDLPQQIETHTLTISASPSEAGSTAPSSGSFAEGETFSLKANPDDEEWKFVNWAGDTEHIADVNSDSTTVTMPGNNISLTAHFDRIDGEEESDADWPRDTETAIVDVENPATGRVWMDRNLGASRAATSSTDEQAFGDLYQWGRPADGHHLRTSDTTSVLQNINQPGHGDFILTGGWPNDWRNPQNDNLWQGVDGINNPCPVGYLLPTTDEWKEEFESWSSKDTNGAFSSPLKLTAAGNRRTYNGSIAGSGTAGAYWASSVDNRNSGTQLFMSVSAAVNSNHRAMGQSVRCIKDSGSSEPGAYTLNLNESPAGSGSVNGAGAYDASASVSITATSNDGYVFVDWTGDTGYIADPYSASTTVSMPANHITLTANFEQNGGGSADTEIVDVKNPVTGRTWMDRNLGASRAATSSTDEQAFGDLYQWGRLTDGHEKRNSGTNSNLSSTDIPGHGDFITSYYSANFDWRSPENPTLWRGVNGINNPCPSGYRLPTAPEWEEERESWSSNNAAGAIASPLKLPLGGIRSLSDGSISDSGSSGTYWSNTPSDTYAFALRINNDSDMRLYNRAYGASVRCIKDTEPGTYNLNLNASPAGNGSVNGGGVYSENSSVSITATPNIGYIFAGWSGDTQYITDVNSENTTVTMPANDITLTANFEEDSGSEPTHTEVVEVINPATGRIWMDRNLGASRAATSSTDEQAYGDLYQWGRLSDGHEKRDSGTMSTSSNENVPGHSRFILTNNSPNDWRQPQNDDLWQGVNGINNPCPDGFRIPTKDEWEEERWSWSRGSPEEAYASPLKLPVSGTRFPGDGSINHLGQRGEYWTSTPDDTNMYHFSITSSGSQVRSTVRSYGFAVRCIKD